MPKKTTTVAESRAFDKELFKRSVVYNVKTLYRKNMEEATPQQIFQAVSYAVKDQVITNWMDTQEEYEKKDPKIVYYLSMEFLMGIRLRYRTTGLWTEIRLNCADPNMPKR